MSKRKVKVEWHPLALNVPMTKEEAELFKKPLSMGQPKKPISDKERLKMEQALYKVQEKIIAQKYGKECSDCANYGWAVDEEADGVAVVTKVYNTKDGVMILSSESHKGEDIKHEWAKY